MKLNEFIFCLLDGNEKREYKWFLIIFILFLYYQSKEIIMGQRLEPCLLLNNRLHVRFVHVHFRCQISVMNNWHNNQLWRLLNNNIWWWIITQCHHTMIQGDTFQIDSLLLAHHWYLRASVIFFSIII